MIHRTSLQTRFGLAAGLLASATVAAAQGAEAATVTSADNGATVVLAGVLITIAAALRRRVQASVWASRERAFTRRTLRAQRQQGSGRTR